VSKTLTTYVASVNLKGDHKMNITRELPSTSRGLPSNLGREISSSRTAPTNVAVEASVARDQAIIFVDSDMRAAACDKVTTK
jgi:hypothetical protein